MTHPRRYPNVKKRLVKGSWEIYWYWDKKRYTFSPGYFNVDDHDRVEAVARQFAAAVARDDADIGESWTRFPGVRRYLEHRYGTPPDAVIEDDEAAKRLQPSLWLQDYEVGIVGACSQAWAKQSLNILRQLDAFAPGGLGKLDSDQAGKFLEHVLDKGRIRKRRTKKPGDGNSPATRNRVLAICSRFYRWCVATKRAGENPFAHIKVLKEHRPEEIVYCTASERDRIIEVARATGRPDWIAVAIAFYAGCRRSEVFRLRWEGINLETRRMSVWGSKTGKKRLTPISKELLVILQACARDRGPVVPPEDGETWENQADRMVELIREGVCRPENPDLAGRPAEVVGKRLFVTTEKELEGWKASKATRLAALDKKLVKLKDKTSAAAYDLAAQAAALHMEWDQARDGGAWLPAERVGWNAWRHTFATLRAQAGVSLDKISSWMGNSYDICKEHYAQFVPRDAADKDIDR